MTTHSQYLAGLTAGDREALEAPSPRQAKSREFWTEAFKTGLGSSGVQIFLQAALTSDPANRR